jgi:NAD(P)-dependent dehydrogenase (short-subunit alcohol dehydrogenase family)
MKTIVLTGATSGIGKEVALQLLKLGHRLVLGVRNMQKAEKARDELIKLAGNNLLDFIQVDFADLESVKRFASDINEKHNTLDVLINNAGTWEVEFAETVNGIETNLQVNHLSPMLLSLELIPLLQKSKRSRIINTSSGAHRRNILNLEDLEFRKSRYDGIASYSQSKLLNILFSLELKNRVEHLDISVNTVHPGYVKTDLFQKMGARDWNGVPDAKHGAQSALYAALSPDMEGVSGKYIYLNKEDPNLSPLAQDTNLAQKAWDLSFTYLIDFATPLAKTPALNGN